MCQPRSGPAYWPVELGSRGKKKNRNSAQKTPRLGARRRCNATECAKKGKPALMGRKEEIREPQNWTAIMAHKTRTPSEGPSGPSPPSPPNPPPPSMIPLLSTSSHTVHSPRCTAWVKQADQRGSHMHCCLPYHDGGQAVAAAGRAISARLSGRDDPARGRSCVRLIRVFILS